MTKRKAAEKPASTGVVQDDPRSATWFKPGQSGNPRGRAKGSRNKLGEQFISALQQDFEEHGKNAIETVRAERPHEYLKVVASILPKELTINTNEVNELSDEQLAEFVEAVRLAIAFGIPQDAGSRADQAVKH